VSTHKNDTIYTAADIEKYLAGEMSPEARHAMEKAALDDSFLSEAMEGFQDVPVQQWKGQLNALHRQFETGITPAKVIPMRSNSFRMMRVAAAVVLILGGTTLTYVLTKDRKLSSEHPQIAQTNSNKELPAVVPMTDSVHSVSASDASVEKDVAIQQINTSRSDNTRLNTKPVPGNDQPVTSPVTAAETRSIASDEKAVVPKSIPPLISPVPAETKNATVNAPNGNKQTDDASLLSKEEILQKKKDQLEQANGRVQNINRIFKAQVVGPDNSPLPFSNVNVKSDNLGTYADVKGNFRLVSADSLITVEVRSVGYEPATYTLNSNQPLNKIVLEESGVANNAARKSKVQNNAGAAIPKLRKPMLVRDTLTAAEPADGWDNYNTYILNNFELPDELQKSGKHGEISISFEVKPDGKVANVIADPADCRNCNERARQVVEQGPQWKLKKGEKAKTTIKVKY